MNDAKYIGLDVHQATVSAVVLDSTGKLVIESILETKAATVLQFIHGLRGGLHVTFAIPLTVPTSLFREPERKCFIATRVGPYCSRGSRPRAGRNVPRFPR